MPFTIAFSIEGEEQLIRTLKGIEKEAKDWKPEFREIGKNLKKTFSKTQFKSEGSELGTPWPALAPSTVQEKIRLGFGDKGILVRTGQMKKSFQFQPHSDYVVISNPTSYFKYHQSNKPRKKLPRRIMMKLDKQRREEIVKVFQEAVGEMLKGRQFPTRRGGSVGVRL